MAQVLDYVSSVDIRYASCKATWERRSSIIGMSRSDQRLVLVAALQDNPVLRAPRLRPLTTDELESP